MSDYQTCADMSFALNPQALAVGTMLAHRPPDFAEYDKEFRKYNVHIETKPWYNGRERGLVFVMQPSAFGPGKTLYLAVYEHRCSDAICIQEWVEDGTPFNEVSLETRRAALGEEADNQVWQNAKSFPWGAIGKAADYVYKRMERHYQAEAKKRAKKTKKAS